MSVARWGFIALGIAIPLSTALDNILLLAILAVLIGDGRAVWHTLTHNAVARACALLFGALVIGSTYGVASIDMRVSMLGKYIDLAFVPLLMVAARDPETRHRALSAFLAVMLITAVLSWLVGLRMLPVAEWMWRGCMPENPAIFRSSITQNILMVFAVYLWGLRACLSSVPKDKWLYSGLAIFAGSNVLFMVQGKTGYLILLALVLYFVGQLIARRKHKQGAANSWRKELGWLALASMSASILIMTIYQVSPRLQQRINEMATDYQMWQPNAHMETSTGQRLGFYYNTVEMIKQHPLSGVGTGGFESAYAKQVQGKNVLPTSNPHNEYLLIMVQLGVAGLGLLLYLFYTQWHYAVQLPGVFEQDAARGLILTIAITALFNSPLLDHTEGRFFAFMSAMLFANLATGKRNG